ncbi:zinc-ribbon domain-containing protein [Agathobacter sp.]
MFCKNCGENNLDESLFCKSCGARLVEDSFKQEVFSNDTMPLNVENENKNGMSDYATVLPQNKPTVDNNDATFIQNQPEPKMYATLVDCPVCGKKISSDAHTCPNCGNMTETGKNEFEKNKILKNGFLGGLYWLLSSAMFFKALYYWLTIERYSSFEFYKDGEAVQLVLSVIMMIVIVVIDVMVCFTTTRGNQK